MESLILKLLEEVNEDIKEIMLTPALGQYNERAGYKNWQTLSSPLMEILAWQSMRDRNEELMKQAECHANAK